MINKKIKLSKEILPILALPIDLATPQIQQEGFVHFIILDQVEKETEEKIIVTSMRCVDGRIFIFETTNTRLVEDNQIGELLFEEAITSPIENIRKIVPLMMQGVSLNSALLKLGLVI